MKDLDKLVGKTIIHTEYHRSSYNGIETYKLYFSDNTYAYFHPMPNGVIGTVKFDFREGSPKMRELIKLGEQWEYGGLKWCEARMELLTSCGIKCDGPWQDPGDGSLCIRVDVKTEEQQIALRDRLGKYVDSESF